MMFYNVTSFQLAKAPASFILHISLFVSIIFLEKIALSYIQLIKEISVAVYAKIHIILFMSLFTSCF